MKTLLFWQNSPSIHQAPFFRALSHRWVGDVIVIAEAGISERRKQHGWELPDYKPARLIVAPSDIERRTLIQQYAKVGNVHIFSGLHAYPKTYKTLKLVARSDAVIGVIGEPGQKNDGIRSVARRLWYQLLAIKWSRKIDFILAIGALGEDWYKLIGFPENRCYPFGYFVDPIPVRNKCCNASENHQDKTSFIYVGELASWKGLDLLLKALAKVSSEEFWSLNIVGVGENEIEYRKLASDLGISDKVIWSGGLPNSEVRRLISLADYFVLPSRYDGWGAVINEALLAGTPVIVSDACGASDLVRQTFLGYVFCSESLDSLSEILVTVFGKKMAPGDCRDKIIEWAESSISPDVASEYFLNVIENVQSKNEHKPQAPWRY